MTFLEKAKEICKEKGETFDEKEIIKKCPEECGLENKSECMRTGEGACLECWNREMPDTDPKVDEDKEWLDGYEKGKIDGLNDAWELARKIFTTDCTTLQKVFGHSDEGQIIMTITPQEALAKLKAYEEAQIEVGDVVKVNGRAIVVNAIR